jgi:hypothetical protein
VTNYGNKNYLVFNILKIVLLILLGSFLVYGVNSPFSTMAYFSIIIIVFFFTNDMVFGLALLFILILNPWGLFYTSPYDWLFPLTNKVGIPYSIAFSVAIVVKCVIKSGGKKLVKKDYVKKFYRYFTFYLIFLLFWGVIFGHSSKSAYDFVTTIIVFSIFFVLTRQLDENLLLIFNRTVFAFFILHFFVSMIDVITFGEISRILVFGRGARGPQQEGDLIRLFGGVWIALYTMIISLYYLVNRKKYFSNYYLWLIILMSFLTFLNTGTRGWIMGSVFLLVSFASMYLRKILSAKTIISVFIILVLSFFILPGTIKNNVRESTKRFLTVKSLLEGDMTAGGTAGRWDVRGPLILNKFRESPVFGFGFSRVTSDYYDAHIGNHSLLLMGGAVGLFIVWGTVLTIVVHLYFVERRWKVDYGIFVFGLGILSIMIIHSTNMITISFVRMPAGSAFVIALLFNHINALILSSQTKKFNNSQGIFPQVSDKL